MTPIQQQRLMGAGLLLLLVAVLAYVVLSKVGQHQAEQTLVLPEPIEFSSVIEPIAKDGVETTQTNNEAMVDADLQQSTTAENTVITASDAETNQTGAESTASETFAENVEMPPPAEPITRSSAQAETTAKPAATSQSNAVATTSNDRWLIQLGSFSVQQNAQSLKAEAEKLGYKPYIESSQTDKGRIYRVRLPEIANRAQADDIASLINKELNIKPQVSKQ